LNNFVGTVKQLEEGRKKAKEQVNYEVKKAQDEYFEAFDKKVQELKNLLKNKHELSQGKFNVVWDKACSNGDNLEEKVDEFYELMELINDFNNAE
jgi:hypothetical protein